MENIIARDQDYETCQFRMQCLDLAARSSLPHPDADSVVTAAQKFFDFVKGSANPAAG